jgi:cytochrome c oxidase subunit II
MNRNPLSIFSNASDAASRVSMLAWFMILASAVVFCIVIAIMVAAVIRNRREESDTVDLSERGTAWVVWGGAVVPTLILVAVFAVSLGAMRKFSPVPPAVTIRVTGHQWWWQVEYDSANGRPGFETANEIHIPAGQPVRLLLSSADVIHSFWVPQLQGKLDVIPGETNDLRLETRHTGIYGGACAEYCGQQHAHMALTVVAESGDAFAKWMTRQSQTAAALSDSTAEAGRQLFSTTACASCHTIRGTTARGESAPDLTHVGSRLSIAAGTLPNSLGNVEGWIGNPQALKPGTKMPTLRTYSGPQLRALAVYMESLK